MKRFKFIIPIMVVVAVLSLWHLSTDYSEVPLATRILIAAGGSVVSGIISYFMLRKDVHKVDPKPAEPTNKKR
ncbi:hypothetical protein MHH33_14150 [Paenisporosarcina sp. FSL H8-0542]|uniref:hypothetical protein n=1 Tax=unclassified Paenisporosarcina TaxID=2642018 RepID=UPI00034E8A8C|nr:hypothetical protein [Paenisporosarcina sp. HGH0030]EPD52299.1 hypothetical protein HMPREF1210_01652 [Paenisporosarcina sp. HGH0030]